MLPASYAMATPSVTPTGEKMATYRKRGKRWRVEIMHAGKRESTTCDTKAEAQAWAARIETLGASKAPRDSLVSNLLDLYAERASPKKKGKRWEVIRLRKIGQDKLGAVPLASVAKADITAWRERREAEVGPGSVRREWNLLASVFAWAVRDLGWMTVSPMAGIKRPVDPPARTRRVSDAEIEAIYLACGYAITEPPVTLQARAGVAFRLALASAMRAGEMVALRWSDVQGKVARLRTGKTGARDVPLTQDALTVLDQLKPLTEKDGRVLGMTSAQLDSLWRKARDRSGLADLHFHDSRAEALTRLARKVDVLTLARISGHKDLKVLMQAYYRESAQEIAERL